MTHLTLEEEKIAIAWMHQASACAKRARCHRAKCGAVIVADDIVIGQGYNAPPLDNPENARCNEHYELPVNFKYDRTCCIHAEWRAIMDALTQHPEKIHDSVLYFTRVDDEGTILKSGRPYCTVCSRLALDAGISSFVLWHEEGISAYPTREYDIYSHEYTGGPK